MLSAFCKGVLLPRTLIIVILSDVRRSIATERESKDLCIASLPKVAIREFSPCTLCPNDLPGAPGFASALRTLTWVAMLGIPTLTPSCFRSLSAPWRV
jgi:hypothetical protein